MHCCRVSLAEQGDEVMPIGWLDVAAIAFVAQLAVLPGEKVQFIVAGLATRYNPFLVVTAAGSAFAGWTVLEVMFGSYLQRTVPGIYLQMMTAALFFLFSVVLLRSATEAKTRDPESNDGHESVFAGEAGDLDVRIPILGWRIPSLMGNFLPIFSLMAFGEFGDKTQLITIALASRYPHPSAIWAGEMAAIIPVSLLNALFFSKFSDLINLRKAHLVSAVLFAFFGIDTLQSIITGVSLWGRLLSFLLDILKAVLSVG